MADQSLQDKIQNASMWKLMLTLSLPSILAMSINGINTFVDGLFVGQLVGQDGLAAIGLAFPLTMITNGFAAMVGAGASSVLSIALGAEDEETQERVFGVLTLLCLVCGGLLTLIAGYYAENLIAFMGGEGEVLRLGTIYYRITLWGAFFRIFGVAANRLIRAEGKISIAMGMTIVATLMNMVLNPILIGYFNLGIGGAAWATVIAMVLYSLLDVWYFWTGRMTYPVRWKNWKLDWDLVKPILLVGGSAMTLQIMFFVQQAVVFKSIAYYGGADDQAFMGACYRVVVLLLLPSFGFSHALQPVVGINYGAQKYDRVREAFSVYAITNVGVVLLIVVIAQFFPATILRWLLPEMTFEAQHLFNFRMMMSSLPLIPIFLLGGVFFQSIGDAKTAGILVLSREVLLYVPSILTMPLIFGIDGIYFAGIPVNIIFFFVTGGLVWRSFRKWRVVST